MAHRRRTIQAPLIVEHEVVIAGLDPRHEGVRIAHLSDLHVGRATGKQRICQAIELANAADADLIVLTGDYVTFAKRELALLEDQLAGLVAPHVFAVLGNHDFYCDSKRVTEILDGHGYTVLRNASVTVDLRGAPLHVIGIDDPVTYNHDLDTAFANVPEGGTRLVLCHGPELANKIAKRGADLILSGHTHGGQIFLKGITDKIVEKIGLRYLSGFYEIEQSWLYVTPGIGSSSVPLRVGQGTRAEVAVHRLTAA